ncbi:MAG TPA: murein L,D-transpeptidase family protein [Xanthobacteraceae bacterium]|nr:murein L,D-transpeptidase family protein [Xanthobacteraceae bacterium]
MIRTCVVRTISLCARNLRVLVTSVVLAAAALALAGCYGEEGYQIPTRAMKELSPEMLGLLQQKNMPKDSPILVRIFKEESELEVWKQDTTGQFQLLKVYPICRWSGELGPKKTEGDRQAPEGFYAISPGLMNPNSSYYLAINIGFPNAYDKANGYSGAFLMIHGDCSSRGCYAMTDEQIGEIYSLARDSFLGGQKDFQIQAYPFRMTPANLAKHRNNPNMPFWMMLKEGDDHFEVTHLEPKVDVCDRRYVFDAQPPEGSTKPLVFNPTGRCPAYQVPQEIAGPALEKQHNDEYQLAQLIKENVPTEPVVWGTDGGMNRVFAAKLAETQPIMDNDGHLHAPPIHPGMPAPMLSGPRENPQDGFAQTQVASSSPGMFGGLFNSQTTGQQQNPPPPAPAADSAATPDPRSQNHTNFFASLFEPKKPPPPAFADQGTALAGLNPNPSRPASPKSEPPKAEPQIAQAPKPKTRPQNSPQLDANAAAPSSAATGSTGMMKGAQPVVPTGSFDGRWAGLQ